MGDPKRHGRRWVEAFIQSFAAKDGRPLRWEIAITIPAERVIIAWKAWDFTDAATEDEIVDTICDFCAAHGVHKLKFFPEMLPLSAAASGSSMARVPWVHESTPP